MAIQKFIRIVMGIGNDRLFPDGDVYGDLSPLPIPFLLSFLVGIIINHF